LKNVSPEDVELDMGEIYHDETLTPKEDPCDESNLVTIKPSFGEINNNLQSDLADEEMEAPEQDVISVVEDTETVSVLAEDTVSMYGQDEDEDEGGQTWKLVCLSTAPSKQNSPEAIHSFKPFQDGVPVPSHCMSMSMDEFCLDDEDYNFHAHKCNRQSVINEDDFHTPIGSPVRTPVRSPARSPEIVETVTSDSQVVDICEVQATQVVIESESVPDTPSKTDTVMKEDSSIIPVTPSAEVDSDDEVIQGELENICVYMLNVIHRYIYRYIYLLNP
jgi:hypothetical protein